MSHRTGAYASTFLKAIFCCQNHFCLYYVAVSLPFSTNLKEELLKKILVILAILLLAAPALAQFTPTVQLQGELQTWPPAQQPQSQPQTYSQTQYHTSPLYGPAGRPICPDKRTAAPAAANTARTNRPSMAADRRLWMVGAFANPL